MGSYTVERSITVKAPAPRVHGLVDDFHSWTSWSPWEDLDPALERTYSGPDHGIGAHYAWTGNRKAGAGSMEITRDTAEEIVIALQFLKPFKSSNTTTFELVERDGDTHVSWRMVGPKTFMTRVMGIFTSMDKIVGKDYERGLDRLKAAATATG